MKKLLTALFIILIMPSISLATTYYVKNGGDNGKDGLSDANAWATITYVNSQNFANNDTICLKRGSTFTDATLTLDSTSVGRSGITIQDYDSGDKPWINGNSVHPIYINHALVNLTLKNIDISGSDTANNRCLINNVNGIIIDGVDYNGHTGSSSYVRSSAMAVSYVDGDIEIKNCTIQNVMKDTFANTATAWGGNDATGLIMYYSGDANVKLSGTVSIHDNVIHDIYSDCLQLAGIHTTTNVYDNELYRFGENAVDMKYSRYIDFYRNTVYHDDYGVKETWFGVSGICSGASTSWSSTYRARDNIVRENYLHTSKYIAMSTPGESAIIKNNYIKNCALGIYIVTTGAKVYNNVLELTTGKPTVEPYASRWGGSMLSGIRLTYALKANTQIYNNTLYISSNDHLYGIAVEADADVTGTIIKNNIIQMARDSSSVYPIYIEDYDNSGNLPTVQYNNTYGVHSNRVRTEETPGNWTTYDSTEQADWRTAGHTGALFTNPLLTNPSAGDLTLQTTSLAIDVGANLGVDYDDALDPDSTWPDSVATLDQDLYGDGWEIGAYIFDMHISNASPIQNATGISITTDLNWTNPTNTTSIDLLFDKKSEHNPPTTVKLNDQVATTWDCGTLDYDTEYAWRVDVNHAGGTETGTIYYFTTTSQANPPVLLGGGVKWNKNGVAWKWNKNGIGIK